MLKYIMKVCYGKIQVENKDLFFEFYKYENALPILLNLRLVLYLLFCLFLTIICSLYRNIGFTVFTCSVSFILLAYIIVELIRKNPFKRTPYEIRTMRLQEKIIKNFVTIKSNVISKSGWKKIKKVNKGLYKDLLSDECRNVCYYYAREIALIVKDVKLMYVSICDHLNDNETCAHVIIRRNDEIYCTNFRRTFKLEDYTRFFDMKIYKEWDYEEYKNPDFCKLVKKDFVNWCNENDVHGYERF